MPPDHVRKLELDQLRQGQDSTLRTTLSLDRPLLARFEAQKPSVANFVVILREHGVVAENVGAIRVEVTDMAGLLFAKQHIVSRLIYSGGI